jgi:glycolate oxidase FAD binding subunit
MDLGNQPRNYDIALDLSALNAVVEHSPQDLVVTVQAGVTIGALNQQLAGHGQFLALDTPLAEPSTVGGALSANLPGPNRLRYGSGRDLVIGMTCVLSGGECVHSGGRVVKNVAGYDLNKLYIGALGTLGVITEVSFKLHPQPAVRRAIAATFRDSYTAHGAAMAIANSSLGVIAIELAGPDPAAQLSPVAAADADWLLVVSMAGLPDSVERQSADTNRIFAHWHAGAIVTLTDNQRERTEGFLRDFGRGPGSDTELLLRCSVLAGDLSEAIDALREHSHLVDAAITASPAFGNLRLAWAHLPIDPEALVRTIRAQVRRSGGTVTIERCPPELKAQLDVWGIDGPDIALMRDMKAAYDPAQILSPGRFVSRL